MAALASFVSVALGAGVSFSFLSPSAVAAFCPSAGRFSLAAALRRLAAWLGLSCVVAAFPLSSGAACCVVVAGVSGPAVAGLVGRFAGGGFCVVGVLPGVVRCG